MRVVDPNERKPNTLKNFLGKSTGELTVGDTFLMQAGNTLIMVAVPTIVTGLGIILSRFGRQRPSQESQRL